MDRLQAGSTALSAGAYADRGAEVLSVLSGLQHAGLHTGGSHNDDAWPQQLPTLGVGQQGVSTAPRDQGAQQRNQGRQGVVAVCPCMQHRTLISDFDADQA